MGFDPNQFTLSLIQGLGQQIQQGRQQVEEDQILGQLIPQLQQSQDPNDILSQILQAQVTPGLTQQTKQNLQQLAGPVSQAGAKQEQQELRRSQLEQAREDKLNQIEQKKQELSDKQEKEFREKTEPLNAALDRIRRQRDLLANGNLGRGSGFKSQFGGKTAREKSEFERLGKSLISLSTNIPIRNRFEFETLANDLIDATQPAQALEGTLDAMERIISDSLRSFLPEEQRNELEQQTQQQQPPQAAGVQTPQGQQNITLEDIRREKERRQRK